MRVRPAFSPFGIGSSVNRYLIDGIAQTGMGEAFVVTPMTRKPRKTAEKFRNLYPISAFDGYPGGL